ncbi:uncharacterized protein LOC114517100 [Dendronephthya gigantea]|uniref:uncharacterized protein LOC114517100 n=1 Tax=Dendronephthya gigantea TaxID=151771 RepID=UPI001069F2E3|nr:uncharacterized protein LOC114517100 [Dendronephthya gigantea]
MESPKFIICPECNERYNDTSKRRLIDTCGHPRCYSCLFKDNPCPVCTKLPQRRERARTMSHEKLLEVGETGFARYQRLLSDTAATTFTGMFRKDSYLKTLYSYDPSSKGYNMEETIRKYRSLEILNDRTRTGSICSDVSSETFMSALHDSTPEQRSLSSSIDDLDHDSPKSSPDPSQDCEKQKECCPKAWPSCPDLSSQGHVWQMRPPAIERRKRPSSLYQIKYSTNSPRSSLYSPRSSGYWSELEQLSESETFSPTQKQPTETTSLQNQDQSKTMEKTKNAGGASVEEPKTTKSEPDDRQNKLIGARQMTRDVFQQPRFKVVRTRSSECLPRVSDCVRGKTIQRFNSMPIERHTKKISENNRQRKAFMTDV